MFRSKLLIAGFVAAALSLVAVERSDAQVRFHIGGGSSRVGVTIGRPYWGGYYGNGYYGNPYGYGYGYAPYNYNPGWYYNPGTPYYPPTAPYGTPTNPPLAEMNTATIEVHVPANAELWFDGTKTTQTGAVRIFVTPPLAPGNTNNYELRATWTDAAGAPVAQARMVQVQPGQHSVVNMAK